MRWTWFTRSPANPAISTGSLPPMTRCPVSRQRPISRALQEAPELVVASRSRSRMRMQRDRDTVPAAISSTAARDSKSASPGSFVQLDGLAVVVGGRDRGQNHHIGPGGGEEPRRSSSTWASSFSRRSGSCSTAGTKPPTSSRSYLERRSETADGSLGKKALGPGLQGRQAQRRGLSEHPVDGHLVAPVRDLDDPPRHRGARHPRPAARIGAHLSTSTPAANGSEFAI